MGEPVNKDEYRHDQILEHEYDGIQEYDNRLPNWWLWILWGSVIFSLGYWLYFQTFGVGKTPAARFELEMQAAAEAQLARGGDLDDAALVAMSGMPARVAEGQKLFASYCVACHLGQGEGLVGPNLTDDYWIHGDAPMQIYATVRDGVLDKGMAAWGKQLGPKRVESLVAFLLTLKGTKVPGKAPEGALVE